MSRPKVLLIRPIAGHSPAIMDRTLKALESYFDVDMPVNKYDTYAHYLAHLKALIPQYDNIIGICQGGAGIVHALKDLDVEFKKIVLIAAPIDTRVNETIVGAFIRGMGYNLIYRYKTGSMISGDKILVDYISLDPRHHIKQTFKYLYTGSQKIKDFYYAYRDTEDMTLDFFKEAIYRSFMDTLLPLKKLNKTNHFMVVEGLKDNITAPGQTSAILDLLSGLPEDNKKALLVTAGHYGTFNGSKFEKQVVPELIKFFN